MPRYKKHTRESIERIRETIDTDQAVKELHNIGHDPKNPPSVRVKALQVLLDKTLPSLTQADVNNTTDSVRLTYQDLVDQLSNRVGQDAATKLLEALGQTSPDGKALSH